MIDNPPPPTSEKCSPHSCLPAQIKTFCVEMIKLINNKDLVYLFESFSVFQDNSRSLLSYIVAYYLKHFDEVCFGSCLFESLFCFPFDLLRNPSRALVSSPLPPEDTEAYPLSNYLFFFSSFTAETNLSPPLWLYFNSPSVPRSTLFWLHSNLQPVHWHSIQRSHSVNS